MNRTKVGKGLAGPCGLVLVLAVSACNSDRDRSRQTRGHEGAPITLTGCLQKSGGLTSLYVLTQVNEPTRSVGTSGSAQSQPGAVEQEQMREAKHAYRLDGDKDQLGNLVGKQVKVEGTIAENSDLNKRAAENRDNSNKGADIDTDDLAKVDVTSIAAVSNACGNSANDQQKP